MAPRFPSDTAAQAAGVLAACKQIDPDLLVGALSQTAFADTLTQTQAVQTQINALELQLTSLRNKRDEQLGAIWENVKRVRASVKGRYGDDSSEYELIGGKRMSERRRSTRRTEA